MLTAVRVAKRVMNSIKFSSHSFSSSVWSGVVSVLVKSVIGLKGVSEWGGQPFLAYLQFQSVVVNVVIDGVFVIVVGLSVSFSAEPIVGVLLDIDIIGVCFGVCLDV